MIVVWIGTIAELIKLAQVIDRAQKEGLALTPVATGQNNIVSSEWYDLLFPEGVKTWVTKRPIRQTPWHFLLWTFEALWKSVFVLRRLRKTLSPEAGKMKVMVHGDTVSTLIGAIAARLAGAQVLHVEGGLRSFNWLRPFPEEINRVGVSRLASMAFCPGEWACSNLRGLKSIEVVDTHFNTIIDVMDIAKQKNILPSERIPEKYFLFVCHRQENLLDQTFLQQLFERIVRQSELLPCVCILHEPAEESFRKYNLLEKLTSAPQITTLPRQNYFEFTSLLRGAEYVVTDGGSNQEECYFLGKACLILRKETERQEGLGHNALLSKKDFALVDSFLADPFHWSKEAPKPELSPSKIIVDALKDKV